MVPIFYILMQLHFLKMVSYFLLENKTKILIKIVFFYCVFVFIQQNIVRVLLLMQIDLLKNC